MTPETDNSAFTLLFVLIGWAALFSWLLVTDRWRRGVPLVAYVPRRRVPWNGAAVGLLLLVFVACQIAGVRTARRWLGPEEPPVADVIDAESETPDEPSQGTPAEETPPTEDTPSAEEAPPADTNGEGVAAHPLVRFLAAHQGAWWAIALAAGVGVLVAPLVEELLFRVLLQGWLEARESRWRRQSPLLKQLPRGVLPVVLPALVFASMHFRSGPPPVDTDTLGPTLLGNALGSLASLLFAVCVLRLHFGADAADVGLNLRPWFKDVGRGAIAFAVLLVPIYLVQLALTKLLAPWEIAADPFALFLLAIALGYLYYRTHRLLPSLALHVCINLFGLLATWLATQQAAGLP